MAVSPIFRGLDISVSALQAQRRRMDVVAANMANAESTRTPGGGPYQRQHAVFEAVLADARDGTSAGAGVRVAAVVKDSRPPVSVHMPGHPDADASGNVLMPDIHPAEEMAEMSNASRAYEANAAAFKITRGMMLKALDLGHG